MILECPECSKRYLVDPRAIGEMGREVRCAGCKHEWHAQLNEKDREQLNDLAEAVKAELDDDAEEAADVSADNAAVDEDDPEDALEAAAERRRRMRAASNVPAITTPKPLVPLSLKLATVALALLFICMLAITFQPRILGLVPATEQVYDMIGLGNSDGIVLADVGYQRREVGMKDSHEFQGVLMNTSNVPRQMPKLRFVMLGAEGQMIKRLTLSEKGELAAGGKQPFSKTIETSPGVVAMVVIEQGNGMELQLRPDPDPEKELSETESSEE